MALARCANCNAQISTKAMNCLHCGAPIQPNQSKRWRTRMIAPAFGSRTKLGLVIASLAIVFMVLVLMFGRG